jgi:uncharacterized protein (DUF1778 family)
MNTPHIAFRIPCELLRKLRAAAKEEATSLTDIMVRALRMYLG